jgi:hypothetical protein
MSQSRSKTRLLHDFFFAIDGQKLIETRLPKNVDTHLKVFSNILEMVNNVRGFHMDCLIPM